MVGGRQDEEMGGGGEQDAVGDGGQDDDGDGGQDDVGGGEQGAGGGGGRGAGARGGQGAGARARDGQGAGVRSGQGVGARSGQGVGARSGQGAGGGGGQGAGARSGQGAGADGWTEQGLHYYFVLGAVLAITLLGVWVSTVLWFAVISFADATCNVGVSLPDATSNGSGYQCPTSAFVQVHNITFGLISATVVAQLAVTAPYTSPSERLTRHLPPIKSKRKRKPKRTNNRSGNNTENENNDNNGNNNNGNNHNRNNINGNNNNNNEDNDDQDDNVPWVKYTLAIYVASWVLFGLVALVVGSISNNAVVLRTTGFSFLGNAVAATYSYFGIDPHRPSEFGSTN
ncbi:hypothetical protein MHU86_9959 [Fragilaria crotonensis]|nr:hypothetical protein MHU86_9959 [Fragilaria crotonensis]